MTRFLTHSLIVIVVATSFVTTGLCQQAQSNSPEHSKQRITARIPSASLSELSGSLRDLAGKVSPAVVQIEVSGIGPALDSGRKETSVIVRQHAIGAGVIVDADGYIMTNAHVVLGAQRIRVVLSEPPSSLSTFGVAAKLQVFDAKLIGVHQETDLALLKIEATKLPTLPLSLDRSPQPGELVFAIGSPEGLQNSVTMGVISSTARQLDPDNPMVYLQTDAPINPGNSGGPLVDVTGAVVGINTMIISSGGGNEGLGFAIPARIVDFVYHSLRRYGHVDHIEIGAVAQTITPTMAEGLGLVQNWGVMIADVIPQGPADTAGIKPTDIVVAVDGQPILTFSEFTAALYLHSPDNVLQLDALRGTKKLSFNVPAILARDRIHQLADFADPSKSHIEQLGILALDLDDDLLSLFPDARSSSGVVVLGHAQGLKSVETGLRAGDVIHSLNLMPIDSSAQLRSALSRINRGDAAVLRIERNGRYQYLAFEME
jgi:serine protease Do